MQSIIQLHTAGLSQDVIVQARLFCRLPKDLWILIFVCNSCDFCFGTSKAKTWAILFWIKFDTLNFEKKTEDKNSAYRRVKHTRI